MKTTGRPRRIIAAVALAIVSLIATQAPAGAWFVERDYPKITEQNLDFGRDYFLGAPLAGGWLNWYQHGTENSARLFNGYLYINNSAGTCGRMRLVGYDPYGDKVATVNGGTVCASSGALHKWSVDLEISATYLTEVKVVLQVLNSNGTYSKVGSQTWFMG